MKTFARVAALFSFTLFFLAGLLCVCFGLASEEAWTWSATVLGLILMGVAFFAGPMLWLAGEKLRSKQI